MVARRTRDLCALGGSTGDGVWEAFGEVGGAGARCHGIDQDAIVFEGFGVLDHSRHTPYRERVHDEAKSLPQLYPTQSNAG
jgi:hypothetical protein